jgi:hypothetical protein
VSQRITDRLALCTSNSRTSVFVLRGVHPSTLQYCCAGLNGFASDTL